MIALLGVLLQTLLVYGLPQDLAKQDWSFQRSMTINEKGDTLFYSIGGFAITSADELFISDRLGFKIRKFDRNGIHLLSTGAKGEGPSEFRMGPGKLAYDSYRKKLAVIDGQLPIIKVFDEKLNYERSFFAPAPIVDLVYDDLGRLIVAVVPSKGSIRSITILDEQGNPVKSFDPKDVVGESWLDAFTIDFHRYHRKIVVVFFHRNIIQILDLDGRWEHQFSIQDLPEKVRTTKRTIGNQPVEFPENFLFWDVASDGLGNIYLLGAHYSKYENKTIYVTNAKGKLLTVLKLPIATGSFSMNENGMLITKENYGTAVGVYHRK